MNPRLLWRRFKEWVLPVRRLRVADIDGSPEILPRRDLVLLRADGEDWCVAMACPCGCGQRVELPLIHEAVPRWRLNCGKDQLPSLYPSVWLREGCRSHYHVRAGKILWVS